MNSRRLILTGFFWLIISILVALHAIEVGIGTARHPGSGFLPFWSGIVLGIFSIILTVQGFLKKREAEKRTSLWSGVRWDKVILVLIALFLYSFLLPKLGYLITTFGLMILLFGMIGRPQIWIPAVGALVTVLLTYLVFYAWLFIPLPRGIFSF